MKPHFQSGNRPLQPYRVFAIELGEIEAKTQRELSRRWIEYRFYKAEDATQAIEVCEAWEVDNNRTTRTGIERRVLGARLVREGVE